MPTKPSPTSRGKKRNRSPEFAKPRVSKPAVFFALKKRNREHGARGSTIEQALARLLPTPGTSALEALARETQLREHPAERRGQPRSRTRSWDRRPANGTDLSINSTSGH